VTSYTVAKGDTISHFEYDALKTDINVCYNHIANTDATLASVVERGTVTWANFVTYQAAATYITNNRLSFAGPQLTPTPSGMTFVKGWGQASGNIFARCTGTITWASAEACRFFFNQGNYLQFATTYYLGSGAKTEAWKTLWSGLGFTYGRGQLSSGYSKTSYMSTNPYGYNPPHTKNDYVAISMSAPSNGSISFSITLNDGGQDNQVLENITTDLTFMIDQVKSNQAGITTYIPTINLNAPVFSAT
jgi:hypothetical protein